LTLMHIAPCPFASLFLYGPRALATHPKPIQITPYTYTELLQC
jgi:hypothetical protein